MPRHHQLSRALGPEPEFPCITGCLHTLSPLHPDHGEHAWTRTRPHQGCRWDWVAAEPRASGEPRAQKGVPPLSLLQPVQTPRSAPSPTACHAPCSGFAITPSLLPPIAQWGKASYYPIF